MLVGQLHCHGGQSPAAQKRLDAADHRIHLEWVAMGARDDRAMDCLLPDGTTEPDPAKSITVYTPGPNGVLTGVFHTDIKSGACKGNVDMPVTAAPTHPP